MDTIVLGKKGYQSPRAYITTNRPVISPFKKFTIKGYNFTAFLKRGNPAVSILIDGKPLTGAKLTSAGKFKVTLVMPPFEPGNHVIDVFGIQTAVTVEDDGGVITQADLRGIIERDFIVKKDCHLLFSDERYRVCPVGVLKCYLGKSGVSRKKYIAEWFDCDDFSDSLHGQFTFDTYPQGYAHGELWVETGNGGGHAINCFCVNEADKIKMVVVEPQSGKIFKEWPKTWRAFMIKI